MPRTKAAFFPPTLIFLDIIGTVLLGLGLAKYFADVDVIPVSLRFDYYGQMFIGMGAALILPLMVHVGSKAKSGAPDKQP